MRMTPGTLSDLGRRAGFNSTLNQDADSLHQRLLSRVEATLRSGTSDWTSGVIEGILSREEDMYEP